MFKKLLEKIEKNRNNHLYNISKEQQKRMRDIAKLNDFTENNESGVLTKELFPGTILILDERGNTSYFILAVCAENEEGNMIPVLKTVIAPSQVTEIIEHYELNVEPYFISAKTIRQAEYYNSVMALNGGDRWIEYEYKE